AVAISTMLPAMKSHGCDIMQCLRANAAFLTEETRTSKITHEPDFQTFKLGTLTRGHGSLIPRLKQPWCKVLQVAAPCLPFVVCAGRLVKDVLDLPFIERSVQILQPGFHLRRLIGPNADPQQMHPLCKRGRIGH